MSRWASKTKRFLFVWESTGIPRIRDINLLDYQSYNVVTKEEYKYKNDREEGYYWIYILTWISHLEGENSKVPKWSLAEGGCWHYISIHLKTPIGVSWALLLGSINLYYICKRIMWSGIWSGNSSDFASSLYIITRSSQLAKMWGRFKPIYPCMVATALV